MRPASEYDVVIVGSGFGGSVTACRLAEAGHRVLVLERGRRWRQDEYPRALFTQAPWIYDCDDPQDQNGWLDVRVWRHMTVVSAAGVGGGSLVYANVSEPPPEDTFDAGWPPEITYEGLRFHLDTVGEMLDVQKLPDNQLTHRFVLMRDAANAIGDGHRFEKFNLAVRFNEDWSYDLEDPFSPRNAKFETNRFGKRQGTCIHCGQCDIGCPVHAKNTLDVNYLALAESKGAEVRPLHLVRSLERFDGGYTLHVDRIDAEAREVTRERVTARRVVLAAGSIGSTELLLRCRGEHRTLPNISGFLGRNWSSNGDFMTLGFYNETGRPVEPTHGPTITASLNYFEGEKYGQERFHVEDGGFPPLMRSYLEKRLGPKAAKAKSWRAKILFADLRRHLNADEAARHIMPWFANGVDAANGRMYLGRSMSRPWRRRLRLSWDIKKSKELVDRVIDKHRELTLATGGKHYVFPGWRYMQYLITPHPLGGCNMGTSPANGVVDHRGRVFGYDGLYVIDGAILPEAIGINPSRTIAAIAERCAGLLVEEMEQERATP
ncbi:MAG: GMC family oxidoreductase [Actinomycetota bacterium]|nr:GMC family oxidoreductase [Actinomycetota bacterium]